MSGADAWSAKRYLQFEEQRTRPARDLLAAVALPDARHAVDLGCGPGNSTELLAARFPGCRILGIDSSSDMVEAARKRLPAQRFEVQDVRGWAELADPLQAPPDLILANAVLHWVPDHARVLPALLAKLSDGGCLAFQVPDNLDEPAQRAMRTVASSGSWKGKLAGVERTRVQVESPGWYYERLRPACSRVEVWRTTYHHALSGAAAIVDWFKGSGLLPFLAPLDEAERADYLARYTEAIEAAYPPLRDGTVLLPFPRLFVVAVR